LLTNFDIDVTQFSFDGKNLKATMAAIQAVRTSTMINYALNNDDKDYAAVGIRIGKYIKHGFKMLYPVQFNMKRFEACPPYISNKCVPVDIRLVNHEDQSNTQLIHHPRNNMNDFEYKNLVWSRNYDCFHVQQKFRLQLLFNS